MLDLKSEVKLLDSKMRSHERLKDMDGSSNTNNSSTYTQSSLDQLRQQYMTKELFKERWREFD